MEFKAHWSAFSYPWYWKPRVSTGYGHTKKYRLAVRVGYLYLEVEVLNPNGKLRFSE